MAFSSASLRDDDKQSATHRDRVERSPNRIDKLTFRVSLSPTVGKFGR